jgi:hypothetical protein
VLAFDVTARCTRERRSPGFATTLAVTIPAGDPKRICTLAGRHAGSVPQGSYMAIRATTGGAVAANATETLVQAA